MKEKFLSVENWNGITTGELFSELETVSDNEKCEIIFQIGKKLIDNPTSKNLNSAETVLVYATQHFFNVTESQYKALVYYRLGQLYEYKEDYIKAYTAYEKYALNNTEFGNSHSVLLRMLILRDDFRYSDKLEKELRMSYAETDLGLKIDRLYENLGSLIVAEHYGDDKNIPVYIKRLKAIVEANRHILPDLLMKKDTIRDIASIPQKVTEYIEKLIIPETSNENEEQTSSEN